MKKIFFCSPPGRRQHGKCRSRTGDVCADAHNGRDNVLPSRSRTVTGDYEEGCVRVCVWRYASGSEYKYHRLPTRVRLWGCARSLFAEGLTAAGFRHFFFIITIISLRTYCAPGSMTQGHE